LSIDSDLSAVDSLRHWRRPRVELKKCDHGLTKWTVSWRQRSVRRMRRPVAGRIWPAIGRVAPAVWRAAQSSVRGDPWPNECESSADEADPCTDGRDRSPEEARCDMTGGAGHLTAATCRPTGNSVAGRIGSVSWRRVSESAGASRRADGAHLPPDGASVL